MADNTSRDIWIAGAFAAFSVDLLVYPLDTLKTRFQSPDYQKLFTHESNGAINRSALFRGLYQGLGSVIIATLPSSGAFFTTYEGTKTLLSHTPLATPLSHALASSLAELVSCAILTPAEVLKQNAQMLSSGSGSATLRTLSKFRSNPLALWRGYSALAGRNLPFTALQFPMFERLKTYIHDRRDAQGKRTGSILESACVTAVAAGTAGSVAAVVTTPVDVVKTRIMLAAMDDGAGSESKKSSGSKSAKGTVDALGQVAKQAVRAERKTSMQVAREVVAERGVARGLFRGGALRAVWTMVGSGLYLGVYEGGRLWLGQRSGTLDD